jgi:hypothetical protein
MLLCAGLGCGSVMLLCAGLGCGLTAWAANGMLLTQQWTRPRDFEARLAMYCAWCYIHLCKYVGGRPYVFTIYSFYRHWLFAVCMQGLVLLRLNGMLDHPVRLT